MKITVKLINENNNVRLYHTDNGHEIRHLRIDESGLNLKQRQRTLRDKLAKAWAGAYAYHQQNNFSDKTSEWVVI